MTHLSNNSESHRVLAVGRDISRLSSRANVLTQAGYTADLVLESDRAIRQAPARRYHLAVVSTTFGQDEQIAIRAQLRQVNRDLPVLLLGPEHDSPDTFLAAVATCLKQRNILQFGPGTDDFQPDRHGR